MANPFNTEPKFQLDPVEPAVWDTATNRWIVFDGKKVKVDIGNFLNYRPTELVRGISFAIDMKHLTPPTPLVMTSTSTDQVIVSITADIEIKIMYRPSNSRIFLVHRKTDENWSNGPGSATSLPIDTNFVLTFGFVRSIADPRHICFTYGYAISGGYTNSAYVYSSKIEFKSFLFF